MDPVATHASTQPDHPAVIAGDVVRTYAELDARANRLARVLAARGVGPGERVAVMLANGVEWFEANLATARLGAQVVPVNWHLLREEIAWILGDADARTLVTHTDLRAQAEPALAAVPQCASVWVGADYEELLAAADPSALSDGASTPGIVLYTSGTTGRPKGVVHEQAQTDRSRTSHVELWAFTPDDVHANVGPLYHGAPWSYAMTHLALGATVVTLARWDARVFLDLVGRHSITNAFMVPTHFARLLEVPEAERAGYDLSRFHFILHSGAACPVPLKLRILDALPNVDIWEFYGFSEAGRVSRIGPNDWRLHPGSVGKPFDGVHVVILDDDGREVPTGATGWIYVVPAAGDTFHYRNNPEATRAITHETAAGAAITGGDLGHVDADGYLYVTDRSVDLVVRGGVNIYPREVEDAMHRHPAVADCAVFGVPDPVHGERLVALVELVAGTTATPAELEEHCRAHLAGFKCPEVRLIDSLPRDPNGKIRKALLRAGARADAVEAG
jgi:acyl-CoA synthetase (AMP-forming)/AMP-acid ligase II